MMPILKKAEVYIDQFSPIDADKAALLLSALHYSNDDVYHDGKQYLVSKLLTLYSPRYPARDIRIRFYGGPVGSGQWYWGDVYTLIIDRVAGIIQLSGVSGVKTLIDKVRSGNAAVRVEGYVT